MDKTQNALGSALTVELHDKIFAHCQNAARGELPITSNYLKFDRAGKHSVAIFTDKSIREVTKSTAAINIAWLMESPEYCAEFYRYIARDNFYRHFDRIYTFDKDLLRLAPHIFSFLPLGGSWVPDKSWKVYPKTKNVSIIASHKSLLSGHKLRHKIIKKYGSQLDGIMGKGYEPFDSKQAALKPFRYSIVIENTRQDYYFTEKLLDCFATGVIPIYWGCPSIGDFFNTDGIIQFSKVGELRKILGRLSERDYENRVHAAADNLERMKRYVMPEDILYADLAGRYPELLTSSF